MDPLKQFRNEVELMSMNEIHCHRRSYPRDERTYDGGRRAPSVPRGAA